MNFEAVSNPEELIGYLKDKANRLRHTHNDQQLYISIITLSQKR